MATGKSTPAKTTPDKPGDEAKAAEAEAPAKEPKDNAYVDLAASLADDTRTLAEAVREDFAKLIERVACLNETAPGPDDWAASDGVRRIPMAVGDVNRALDGLVSAAANLATKAQRTEKK